jgi:hypothetical protein
MCSWPELGSNWVGADSKRFRTGPCSTYMSTQNPLLLPPAKTWNYPAPNYPTCDEHHRRHGRQILIRPTFSALLLGAALGLLGEGDQMVRLAIGRMIRPMKCTIPLPFLSLLSSNPLSMLHTAHKLEGHTSNPRNGELWKKVGHHLYC